VTLTRFVTFCHVAHININSHFCAASLQHQFCRQLLLQVHKVPYCLERKYRPTERAMAHVLSVQENFSR